MNCLKSFTALLCAMLMFFQSVAVAQQAPAAQPSAAVDTANTEKLGKLLNTEESTLPAQGDRPPTKVITESYENGTIIRRYRTAESLEIRIPAANPGELSAERDQQIDKAFELLGHADPATQKQVIQNLRRYGNFQEWYKFLTTWATKNQSLKNTAPTTSVRTGPTGEPHIVTPQKEWIVKVVNSGNVVNTLGESANPVIRDGFKDDESLIQMAKSNTVFRNRILNSHLAQCQSEMFLDKLSKGDFERLHPLTPPEGDTNGMVYIDENFGEGTRVRHNEILKYDPNFPIWVVTVHLGACDSAPPQIYDVVKRCANPLKRYQEVIKPIVSTLTETNLAIRPAPRTPSCTLEGVTPRTLSRLTESVSIAVNVNNPDKVPVILQSLVNERLVKKENLAPFEGRYSYSFTPDQFGIFSDENVVKVEMLDADGKLIQRCPGDLANAMFSVKLRCPECEDLHLSEIKQKVSAKDAGFAPYVFTTDMHRNDIASVTYTADFSWMPEPTIKRSLLVEKIDEQNARFVINRGHMPENAKGPLPGEYKMVVRATITKKNGEVCSEVVCERVFERGSGKSHHCPTLVCAIGIPVAAGLLICALAGCFSGGGVTPVKGVPIGGVKSK